MEVESRALKLLSFELQSQRRVVGFEVWLEDLAVVSVPCLSNDRRENRAQPDGLKVMQGEFACEKDIQCLELK